MRWKIHLIGIALITLLIFGVYTLFQSSTEATPQTMQPTSNVRMHIEKASWGLNCNQLYDAYKRRTDDMVRQNPNYKPNPEALPVKVENDNVIKIVRTLCQDKPSCIIPARAETMGNFFSDCSKDLDVSWRCFSYDKLRSAKASNGSEITIDCEKPE